MKRTRDSEDSDTPEGHPITQIKKRDGTIVEYDLGRIERAIFAAMTAVGEGTKKDALTIASRVNEDLELIKARHKAFIPEVEGIQDQVETELIKSQFVKVAKAYILYRDEHAKQRATRKTVPPEVKKKFDESKKYFRSQRSEFVYTRTYARWLEEEGRRECWIETVDRYVDFMKENLGSRIAQKDIESVRKAILNQEVMPSMRLLQFAGEPARRSNICGFNCSYTAPTCIKDLADIMFLLMEGTGVGFSVETRNIQQFPVIKVQNGSPRLLHFVQDSSEGWAEALRMGLEAWYEGRDIVFDLSKVRPAGSRLKTKGGKSSGPEPLKELLDFARATILNKQGQKLSNIEMHDIICYIGKVVVVGGVRRSALISLSDLGDVAMREAKHGETWFNENPQRAKANNSAVYEKPPTNDELMTEWFNLMRGKSGERGIFNRGSLPSTMPPRRSHFFMNHGVWDPKTKQFNEMVGLNPCVVGDTTVLTTMGWKKVSELVGKPFVAIVNGQGYPSSPEGFWKTGTKKVFTLELENCFQVTATADHPILTTQNDEFVELKKLKVGQEVYCDDFEVSTVHGVYAVEGEHDVYDCSIPDVHRFVANGIVVHNCGEIILRSYQFCNLTEIVGRKDDTRETLLEKMRIATILGTYQASLTHFPYIREEWKKNCESEALLGVSITGQWDCPAVRDAKVLSELLECSKEINRFYSIQFGINQATALTCVKPSGTTSEVVGCSSGIHRPFAPFYIRRIRVSANDAVLKMAKAQGVPCHLDFDGVTEVLEFPVALDTEEEFCQTSSAIDQLEYWKMVKLNYTEHNPSCTIYVGKDEWISTLNWVNENWDIVGGLAFFPKSDSSVTYKLAPFEAISREKYLELSAKMPNLDFSQLMLYEHEDSTQQKQELACSGGVCELYA